MDAEKLAAKIAEAAVRPMEGHPLQFDIALEMAVKNVVTRILPILRDALPAVQEGDRMGPCEVCWYIAWVPVPADDPDAAEVIRGPLKGTFVRCDYCWQKRQRDSWRERAVRAEKDLRYYIHAYQHAESSRHALERELAEARRLLSLAARFVPKEEIAVIRAFLAVQEDDPTCMEAEHGGHPTCPHMEEALAGLRDERDTAKAKLAEARRLLAECDDLQWPLKEKLSSRIRVFLSRPLVGGEAGTGERHEPEECPVCDEVHPASDPIHAQERHAFNEWLGLGYCEDCGKPACDPMHRCPHGVQRSGLRPCAACDVLTPAPVHESARPSEEACQKCGQLWCPSLMGGTCRNDDPALRGSPPTVAREACMEAAPDMSTRSCDKPKGHEGNHWTYGGRTLEWPTVALETEEPMRCLVDPRFAAPCGIEGCPGMSCGCGNCYRPAPTPPTVARETEEPPMKPRGEIE